MVSRKSKNARAISAFSAKQQAEIVEKLNGMEFNLQQLRQRDYCNVALRASLVGPNALRESEPVYGHRIVLQNASPYFGKLFESAYPNQDSFYIPGVRRATLEFLIDCIYYCDMCSLTTENMFQIYEGSKILELPNIRASCEDFMQTSKNIENCLELWKLGKKEGCARLCDSSFIIQHLDAISKTDAFAALTKDEIDELIMSSAGPSLRLTAPLLLSLQTWMKKAYTGEETERRIEGFLSLVRKLSLEELDHNIFAKIFIDDPQLRNHEGCQKFRDQYLCEFLSKFLQGKIEHSSPAIPLALPESNSTLLTIENVKKNSGLSEKIKISRKRVIPQVNDDGGGITKKVKGSMGRSRKKSIGPIPLVNDQGDHCIAYYIANKDGTRLINSYDFQTGEIGNVGIFENYRENGVFMIVDKYIYYLGGRTIGEGQDSNRIDLFDLKTKTWQTSDLLELDEGRCYFNCAVLDNQIYIVAGFRDESCIDSVERIPITPISTNSGAFSEGEEVTNVRWPKNRSPLAVINGKVYSIGGAVAEGGENAWASAFVECYDPSTNKWTDVKRMPTPRVGHAVVVLDAKLYALGGGTREEALPTNQLTTVEVYDPVRDHWENLKCMKKKRQYGSAFTFDGYIYAVGGDSTKFPTMERYDPKLDTWQLMSSSSLPADADYSSMIFQISDLMKE